MKAVKLSKIRWDLSSIPNEEKKNVEDHLPIEKGFTVDDDFNVSEKVPVILKKKYGFPVLDFSFTEIKIIDKIEDLLKVCAPRGKSEKDMFNMSGTLSVVGRRALENLESNIRWRLQLEKKGVSPFEMPKVLDEVMLGVENLSEMEWEGHTTEELLAPIKKKIYAMAPVKPKKSKSESSEIEEPEEE